MRRPISSPKDYRNRAHWPTSGQTTVEFALALPIFLLLICATLDFGRLFFEQMTLQYAMREAGRYAVTGNTLPGTNPSTGLPYTRIDSIKQIAQNAAAGLNVSSINISSVNGGPGSAGGPNDFVTISLTTSLQLITPIISSYFGPNGLYTFTVSTTFKNEPFNPS
jgi:Flp pilus assembly protein TadG